jgi:hypothetical protein
VRNVDKPRVVFISNHPSLAEKVQRCAQEYTQFDFTVSSTSSLHISPPSDGEPANTYVLPVEYIEDYVSPPESEHTPYTIPVIAYGPARSIRYAFLWGCSDYLRNPWTIEEMVVRIERVGCNTCIRFPWGTIHYTPETLSFGTHSISLSYPEYLIFRLLSGHRGTVVPRNAFFYALWGKTDACSRVVDMHISSLRKKIASLVPAQYRDLIQSVYGRGYYIP